MTSTEEKHNIEHVKQLCRTFLTEYIIFYNNNTKELYIEGDIKYEDYKKLLNFYMYGYRMFNFVVISVLRSYGNHVSFILKWIK